MILPDEKTLHEAARLHAYNFLELAEPDNQIDAGKLLATLLAECARGMYVTVGKEVTLGVMDHVRTQIAAEPERDLAQIAAEIEAFEAGKPH